MSLLRRLAIRFDLAVLLLAHPSQNGINTGTGFSGSTAWHNSVRARLYLERLKGTGGKDDPDARVLRVKKANYGRLGTDIRLRWEEGIFRVAKEGTGALAIATEAKADTLFLELLEAFTADGRHVGEKKGHNYAPALFADDPRSKGVSKLALEKAMARHFAAGRIKVETQGPPSRPHRQIVAVGGVQ